MQWGLSSLRGHPTCVLALGTPGCRKGGGWVVIKMPGQAPQTPMEHLKLNGSQPLLPSPHSSS